MGCSPRPIRGGHRSPDQSGGELPQSGSLHPPEGKDKKGGRVGGRGSLVCSSRRLWYWSGLRSFSEVFWRSVVFFGFFVVVVVVAAVFRGGRIVVRGSQDHGLVGFQVTGLSPTVVGWSR